MRILTAPLQTLDQITSPAFTVTKAEDKFWNKVTVPNQLWQIDFTHLKVIGWGWFYLATILDDFSRYMISWKLCTSMRVDDVSDTLRLTLQAWGYDRCEVVHNRFKHRATKHD